VGESFGGNAGTSPIGLPEHVTVASGMHQGLGCRGARTLFARMVAHSLLPGRSVEEDNDYVARAVVEIDVMRPDRTVGRDAPRL
jgi:hypothetical protein